jgi:hypothetical protein
MSITPPPSQHFIVVVEVSWNTRDLHDQTQSIPSFCNPRPSSTFRMDEDPPHRSCPLRTKVLQQQSSDPDLAWAASNRAIGVDPP